MSGRTDSLRGGDWEQEEERDSEEEGGEPGNHWSISPEAICMICLIKLGRALTIPRQAALRETFRADSCLRYHITFSQTCQPEFQYIPAYCTFTFNYLKDRHTSLILVDPQSDPLPVVQQCQSRSEGLGLHAPHGGGHGSQGGRWLLFRFRI